MTGYVILNFYLKKERANRSMVSGKWDSSSVKLRIRTRKEIGISIIHGRLVVRMLFAIVVALIFSVLFAVAGIMEVCLFRLDDFRTTQRDDYPSICQMLDSIWAVLHLSFIFDPDEDEETELMETAPNSTSINLHTSRNDCYNRAA